MKRLVVGAGWAVALGLSLLTLLRLTHLDEWAALVVAASAGAPVVLLPAYGVLLLAGLLRARALAGVAAALVLVHLVVLFPLLVGGRGLTAAQRSAAALHVRLFAMNVEFDHDTGAAVSRQVAAQDPDVVVLSEVSPLTVSHLELNQFPYSYVNAVGGAFGAGIWSRWPLSATSLASIDGFSMLQATVTPAGGSPFRLLQVHTLAPTSTFGRSVWRQQLTDLRQRIAATASPVVVAGDFNATRTTARFARLLGGPHDMADAADGRGLLPSWPSGYSVLPPVLRLDHVLVSAEWGVGGLRVLSPTGSDHRAVVTDLYRSAP